MTIVTDYELNPNWGWFDFTMVTAIFVIFVVADFGMFLWWIFRNQRRVRVVGVIKHFMAHRIVPLTIYRDFDRRVKDPIMQEALNEVDDFPDNLSQESIDSIALFKDYRRTMDAYFDTTSGTTKQWPATLPYSFELFKQYRTNQVLVPEYINLSFEQWLEKIHSTGQDRRDIGIIGMPGVMQQGSQYPPALGGATNFQAFPGVANSRPFDPQYALMTRNSVM